MNYVMERNRILGEKIVKNLKARYFDAYYCENSKEATETALSLIKNGETVTWGGTMTASEIGLAGEIQKGDYNFLDRSKITPENKKDFYRKALLSDTYIMSANALSVTGEMVNIDGHGNRVAALCYGPEQVIVIIGMNKVEPDLESAINRARTVAAPINAQRFDIDTPCKKTGMCGDCLTEGCICSHIVITRKSNIKNRIKVILVNENLGF